MKGIKGVVLSALMAMLVVGLAEGAVTNVSWKSSAALGATYKSGNTEKSLFTMNLKGDRYAPESDWLNSLHAEYGLTESTTTNLQEQTEGQLRGQSDYRHKFGGRYFFGGVFGEAYYDDIKDIRTRLKIGPNIGYYFINKAAMKLDASIGGNYVYERTGTTEGDFGEWRIAGNYLWNLSDTSSCYLNAEYSANVEDANDGTGLLVTGLKSRVATNLALFVELRDEYDNMPESSKERNDITIIAGLTYDF